MTFHRDLAENLNICPNCKFHLPFYPKERLGKLFDESSFEEIKYDIGQQDNLKFRYVKKYSERLNSAKSQTKHWN